MIKAITKYLREIAAKGGRGGTHDSRARKGFGSAEVRAKAAATRAANRRALREATREAERADREREIMRQAVVRATKGRKA
jgi:hypothetical protein